ncbi:MAG: hypothetical protein JST53_10565 [Actinobacteria bacterium]|nr:hypothetical protein [Actinomycetota bacterium]
MGPRLHLATAIALVCLALLAVASGASAAATQVSLSARVKPAGSDRVLVMGRVTPAPRAARVEVQAKRAGGWRRFVSGRLRHGAFKLSHRAAATLVLRARAFAGRRLLGISPVRTVKIRKSAARGPGNGGPIPRVSRRRA